MPEIETLIDVNNGVVKLNEEVLKNLCKQIGDRNVAVISTAGKFRQGKTFWNNVLLKGLRDGNASFTQEELIGGTDGFAFKCGQERHTRGIMVYSEVFFRKDKQGKEMAVILLDTQGTYDLQSAMQDSQIIFALSLLLSSRKIFNASKNISASDLDSLSVFIAFSKMDDYGRGKIGQDFLILLRDSFGKIGLDGGREYLDILKKTANGNEQLSNFVESITTSFDRVDCCTVPMPTSHVRNATGELRAKECGDEFLQCLSECANFILDTLSPKLIGDVPLTGKKLESYVKNLVEHCKKGEFKGMCSAFEAQSRLWFNIAYQEGMQKFEKLCEELMNSLNSTENLISPHEFTTNLTNFRGAAKAQYDSCQRMGSESVKKEEFDRFNKALAFKFMERVRGYKSRYNEKIFIKVYAKGLEIYDTAMKTKVTDLLNEGKNGIESFGNLQTRHSKAFKETLDYFVKETLDLMENELVLLKRKELETKIEERFSAIEQENATRCIEKGRNKLVDEVREKHRSFLEECTSKVTIESQMNNYIEQSKYEAKKHYANARTNLVEKLCNAFKCLDPTKLRVLFDDYCTPTIDKMFESNVPTFKSQCRLIFLLKNMNNTIKKVDDEKEDAKIRQDQETLLMTEQHNGLMDLIAKFRDENDAEVKARAKQNDELQKAESELEAKDREIEKLRDELARAHASQTAQPQKDTLQDVDTTVEISVINGNANDPLVKAAKKALGKGLDEVAEKEDLAEFMCDQMSRAERGKQWACVVGFDHQAVASTASTGHIGLRIDSLCVRLFRM